MAVGLHGLDELEVANALAKLRALLRTGHALLRDALRHAAGQRGDMQAAPIRAQAQLVSAI